MPVATTDQYVRFGGFTLDLSKGALRRADDPVFLRPKAHALLTHLARNMGSVVPKSELMDVVWPGVFVTEDSLTQSVREIRKAIGDELVRTVSKRGYMLTALSDSPPESAPQPIIAVLRFRNEGGDSADEALVDGFAEGVINGLARFGAVTVLARNSSFSFASYARADWPEIRSRMGADYIVEGSVRRSDTRIAAAVNLVDATSARQLWGERYEAADVGIFGVGQEVVEEIVGRLITRVNNAGLQRASRKPATSLAAYELVLRGAALLRDPAQSDLDGAAAYFQAAITKDPAYGLAYSYLALSRVLAGEFGPTNLAMLSEMRDVADQGAALSPDNATCRRVQSQVRVFLREHEAAEHYLRIALELNPHDAECLEQMGFLLTMRGRPIDALAWLARAIRINPLHPHWYQYDRSLALYLAGDYRSAAESLETSTRPTPWIRTRLAACYAQLGEMDEARRHAALIGEGGADFSPVDYVTRDMPFERPSDAAHLAEGVLLALGRQSGV